MNFTWSYSALTGFETCAKRHYHYNVAKDVHEPESEQQRDGTNLHEAFKRRLDRGTPLPLGLGQFERLLAPVVAAPGELAVEVKLALSRALQPCSYFDSQVWGRTIIDAARLKGDAAHIFDWKTGKPYSDTTQLAVCAAFLMAHRPEISTVVGALVFLNYNKIIPARYDRNDLAGIWTGLLPRIRAMEKARRDQEFPPTPGGLCKRYCAVLSCPHHGV